MSKKQNIIYKLVSKNNSIIIQFTKSDPYDTPKYSSHYIHPNDKNLDAILLEDVAHRQLLYWTKKFYNPTTNIWEDANGALDLTNDKYLAYNSPH